jgi:hypothetical protein
LRRAAPAERPIVQIWPACPRASGRCQADQGAWLKGGGMASFGAKAHSVVMPTPTTTHGGDFTCRHCGALYVVRYIELPIADSGSVYCQVCRRQMILWNSILQPSYRLVKQPDPK